MTTNEAPGWVPETCSLPSVEQPLRMAEFDQLFAESVLRSARTSATRLDLVLAKDSEAKAHDLAAREVACCSFFSFGFDSAGATVEMHIEVPQARTDVLDAITERVKVLGKR
ncbi:hypothetical protein [Mycobacterium hubeiense]|uniref:hypothetical protein n=1 Tax=Mycobacterium hubeiense TaxID=1867256 RepID=UPI000C7F43C0|nr:hypothetical protein [Mycobacterium sp. QGD 101]